MHWIEGAKSWGVFSWNICISGLSLSYCLCQFPSYRINLGLLCTYPHVKDTSRMNKDTRNWMCQCWRGWRKQLVVCFVRSPCCVKSFAETEFQVGFSFSCDFKRGGTHSAESSGEPCKPSSWGGFVGQATVLGTHRIKLDKVSTTTSTRWARVQLLFPSSWAGTHALGR